MALPKVALPPRLVFAAIGIATAGLVAGGVVLARTMNLAACPLCILQRMLYLVLALEALVVCTLNPAELGRRVAGLVMGITAATGLWIAAYQTWLQRFAKNISCTANQPWWESFVEWAGEQVPLLFEATGLCSEAGWKLLGLSIAEWSALAFSCALAAALYAGFSRRTA